MRRQGEKKDEAEGAIDAIERRREGNFRGEIKKNRILD